MISPDASDSQFSVVYNPTINLDFDKTGTVTVKPGSSGFVFTGQTRNFFSRKEITLEFQPSDIRNVTRTGKQIRFATDRGVSGSKKQPFVFDCASEEDASTLVSLLPTTLDTAGEMEVQFAEKFSRLPGADRPLGFVTLMLIGANVAVFLIMALFFNAGWGDANLAAYIRLGANNAGATTDGEWWRLFTSMFMHFGIVHLLCNMWALLSIGPVLERLTGRAAFSVIFLGAGIGGSIVSLLWSGDRVWSAGASGAIFGLYGALAGFSLRQNKAIPRTFWEPLMKSALIFVLYNVYYGLMKSGIDNAAHLGGLASGFLLGFVTALPLELGAREALVRGRVGLGLGVIAAVLIGGVAAAPNYNYHFSEELAWTNFFTEIGQREKTLIERQNQLVTELKKNPSLGAEYAKWIEREFAPFYTNMAQRLEGLKFDPTRRTAKNLEKMRTFARLHAEAFMHLATALRTDNEEEIGNYKTKEEAAQKAVASIIRN